MREILIKNHNPSFFMKDSKNKSKEEIQTKIIFYFCFATKENAPILMKITQINSKRKLLNIH